MSPGPAGGGAELGRHALLSLVQGISVAAGFLVVVLVLRRFHPDLADDFLSSGQNHP